MKLLIMGGHGMAGHMLVQYFRRCSDHSVYYTVRQSKDPYGLYVDVRDWDLTEKVLKAVSPDVVINCIGLLNEAAEKNPVEAYWLNGILPHRLKEAANGLGYKLIHISSDCVFTGNNGNHKEDDVPDGTSVYARSKALGEVTDSPHLTIRTSIIGPEIRENGIGLLQWFMKQEGEVAGYRQAIWNGITTLELAKCIQYILEEEPLEGLLHVRAPEDISKYDLLMLFQQTFMKTNVLIRADDKVKLNRTLLNTRRNFNYKVPGYEAMLKELRNWM
ncbi:MULTISPECIES: dTDP-4-dehydrorhamnose reductase family protein [unclassified Paenibacillus]|uniref:dTDP-4-dehydrorhamnose reductase family protein n=1 Tax=unclassified Paenibacillus TaxID=185978 RepID=UPI00070F6930|nr:MULTISPECIES: SDR family oxidoreductase [unclassified Paenibacillus]KQX49173.1 NAD(P)-dependent oxidoreductase [Paenibacillus sp. Root444D2]KRE48651.1 NAD(P)-dependent oxidoreductase [Paenibacillus sp. Soil724D2]